MTHGQGDEESALPQPVRTPEPLGWSALSPEARGALLKPFQDAIQPHIDASLEPTRKVMDAALEPHRERFREAVSQALRTRSTGAPEVDLLRLPDEEFEQQSQEYIQAYENAELPEKEHAQGEALAWQEWHSTQLQGVIDTLEDQQKRADKYNLRMAIVALVGLGLGFLGLVAGVISIYIAV